MYITMLIISEGIADEFRYGLLLHLVWWRSLTVMLAASRNREKSIARYTLPEANDV